ncbi:MAG TPA: M14-type cytosolic carboxypeptidase [Daejeonella sp.]|uniref:M14-type cytosolic carboxypeptidase n=1 Tax=Daejeonella sp. TaxID=2805397 RepID=UPI002ED7AC65
MRNKIIAFLLFGLSLLISVPNSSAAEFPLINISGNSHSQPFDTLKSSLKYISTNFENASQLDWETDSMGIVNVSLIYDHERVSPNRANGHWHFKLEADSGSEITIILKNFENVWNGIKGVPVSEKTNCLISKDGKNWSVIPADFISGNRLKFTVPMKSDQMYVASVEPYRISDLDKLLTEIRGKPQVEIMKVGNTAEGRPLEIIRIGNPDAIFSVFLRARAHSWEPGGNWVVQGLIRTLLGKESAHFLRRYCVYIMPMTNKDGVARGRTRFNTNGKDLNREWDRPADRILTPEKYAFESWLEMMISKGKKPQIAIDLHNDQGGNIHVNLPSEINSQYVSNMKRIETLLYKHTWFTEGPSHVKNPGSFGEGLAKRYGIDAFVYELNYEWIAGLNKAPMGKDWELLGKQLAEVFYLYFDKKD